MCVTVHAILSPTDASISTSKSLYLYLGEYAETLGSLTLDTTF